jgi:hypothetical protein
MRLWVRQLSFLAGFLALTIVLASFHSGVATLLLFVALVAGSVASVRALRCPHCGEYALTRPSGWSAPWPGTHCRWCGREY